MKPVPCVALADSMQLGLVSGDGDVVDNMGMYLTARRLRFADV